MVFDTRTTSVAVDADWSADDKFYKRFREGLQRLEKAFREQNSISGIWWAPESTRPTCPGPSPRKRRTGAGTQAKHEQKNGGKQEPRCWNLEDNVWYWTPFSIQFVSFPLQNGGENELGSIAPSIGPAWLIRVNHQVKHSSTRQSVRYHSFVNIRSIL